MLARSYPRPLSWASRVSALRLSSATSPYRIDSVGHALAQAVPRPWWMRSLHSVHLWTVPVFPLNEITPKGHDGMQYLHPMQTSCWTKTFPRPVRTIAPVGQALRQPASLQCLHESLEKYQRFRERSSLICSMNRTCRQSVALKAPVLSYEFPVKLTATGRFSAGSKRKWAGSPDRAFHSLHATWHALHPMQMEVSTNIPFAIYAAPPFFPARTLHVKTFPSWIETLGSATRALRLFTTSPWALPCQPQCHGRPISW